MLMSLFATGKFRDGLAVWRLALFGGLCFTIPEALIAIFLGPELPSLIGALIGLVVFIPVIKNGWLTPGKTWDFPAHDKWPDTWEGDVKAGSGVPEAEAPMGYLKSWVPYLLIVGLLLMSRLPVLDIAPMLQSWKIGWTSIFGTSIGKDLAPFYNPGVFPFLPVAILIPLIYGMSRKSITKTVLHTLKIVRPAAVALIFTLAMVYIMMKSGEAAGRDSMLIVLADEAATATGRAWIILAPFVGALGTFFSCSNTVSDIMFGPFQYGTAIRTGLPPATVLALQAVGGAAGNMICIHNVVAALTTVGLVGREGLIIRKNFPICIGYCFLAGLSGWMLLKIPWI